MRRILLTVAVALCLLATSGAFAARAVTKHATGSVTLRPGQTAAVGVPYPDALKYGNARYSQKVAWSFASGPGATPDRAKLRILSAHSILGGSEFQVRAHNGNAAGTAPVRVTVVTTTVEPLPHT